MARKFFKARKSFKDGPAARKIRSRARSVVRLQAALLLILFVFACDARPEKKELWAALLIRPALGLFGDSISAYWPAEELLVPYRPTLIALPFRTADEIRFAAESEPGRYTACLYNGGINDFQGNHSPSAAQLDATTDIQIRTLRVLQTKCGQILALNIWNVEFPWPVLAAIGLNARMKERVTFVDRLDPENWIDSSLTEDGLHLNRRGYEFLSEKVLERLRVRDFIYFR